MLRWMPREMTGDEVRDFLLEGTRTAKLAVVRKDGSPLVAPVWFVLDGDDLLFTTGNRTVKGYALRRDPRVALCVDDDRPPYAFVRIAGTVEISEDLDEVVRWATEIGRRYMGEERAEEFGRRNGVPGELLVRVKPERISSETDVAGY
jgi:PPOX class probable F420-dependent enzyme